MSIDPLAYIRDVLLRVATHPQSRIAELTPKAWAAQLQSKPNYTVPAVKHMSA